MLQTPHAVHELVKQSGQLRTLHGVVSVQQLSHKVDITNGVRPLVVVAEGQRSRPVKV